jgi:hypothetical protein
VRSALAQSPHPTLADRLEDCASAFALMLESGIELDSGWQA